MMYIKKESSLTNQIYRLLISGRVQGVNYRYSLREKAMGIGGVRGWCRNLPDGRVEAVISAPWEKLQRLLSWCGQGPAHAIVEDIQVENVVNEETLAHSIPSAFEILL